MQTFPSNAIIAVTLNCNSRCKMCDIWKNRMINELKPKEFRKLPHSLTDINITGGEPFLRMDLPEIIKVLKEENPKARLVISTNGFLPDVIKKNLPKIYVIDKNVAVRISLDGWENTHNQIRGIPDGFHKVIESLNIAKSIGVKDIGIGFTIIKENVNDLLKVFEFTKKEGIELSLTMVTNSPIYFGQGKESLRPDNHCQIEKQLNSVIIKRFLSSKPKEWYRGWFEQKLLKYYFDHLRPYACDAGRKFFYLDSLGNIYACNIKNWILGNIRQNSFADIWASQAVKIIRKKSEKCHDCWMICSAKTNFYSHLLKISSEVFTDKLKNLLWTKE